MVEPVRRRFHCLLQFVVVAVVAVVAAVGVTVMTVVVDGWLVVDVTTGCLGG